MESAHEPRHAYILDPAAGAGPAHYAAATALIAALLGGVLVTLGLAPPSDTASPTQDAVMVDLPPVEAGAHPQGDDAPPQAAAPASAGAQVPPAPTPETPDEAAKPPAPIETVPEAPAPAAVLEHRAAPTPPVQAPASAPQDAHEAGAPSPAQAAAEDADAAETHRASARRITLWQKALMGRLQAARHGLAAAHATGIVKIAFAIDREGRLVSARVAHGSGSPAADAEALELVHRAAPFPRAPTGAQDSELTFVVPISFRH